MIKKKKKSKPSQDVTVTNVPKNIEITGKQFMFIILSILGLAAIITWWSFI